jgi:hypothetical protein
MGGYSIMLYVQKRDNQKYILDGAVTLYQMKSLWIWDQLTKSLEMH